MSQSEPQPEPDTEQEPEEVLVLASPCVQIGKTVDVTQELKDTLLEFTINFLLHQPQDVTDYALCYFEQVKEAQRAERVYDLVEEELEDPCAEDRKDSIDAQDDVQ